MKRLILPTVALALATSAGAATFEKRIPSADWSIAFDAPPLSDRKESKKPGAYTFSANSGRFNLSFFVEDPGGPGTTHKDCFEYYWPRASRNAMIDKASFSTSSTEKYVRVQYDLVTEFQGKPIRDRNVNYYFVYGGKWIDVHISMIDPRPEDEATFTAFDSSLLYGRPEAATKEAEREFDKAKEAYLAKDYAKAEKHLRVLVEKSPDMIFAHLYLGHALFFQSKYREAIGPYERVRELGAKGSGLGQHEERVLTDQLGMAYGLGGRLDDARRLFEQAIPKDPDYPMYYYNLACVLAEQDHLDEALANLKLGFARKEHMLPGESYPDPRNDDSFKKYLGNEKFQAALKEMGN